MIFDWQKKIDRRVQDCTHVLKAVWPMDVPHRVGVPPVVGVLDVGLQQPPHLLHVLAAVVEATPVVDVPPLALKVTRQTTLFRMHRIWNVPVFDRL